jgi:hypothetical protein
MCIPVYVLLCFYSFRDQEATFWASSPDQTLSPGVSFCEDPSAEGKNLQRAPCQVFWDDPAEVAPAKDKLHGPCNVLRTATFLIRLILRNTWRALLGHGWGRRGFNVAGFRLYKCVCFSMSKIEQQTNELWLGKIKVSPPPGPDPYDGGDDGDGFDFILIVGFDLDFDFDVDVDFNFELYFGCDFDFDFHCDFDFKF